MKKLTKLLALVLALVLGSCGATALVMELRFRKEMKNMTQQMNDKIAAIEKSGMQISGGEAQASSKPLAAGEYLTPGQVYERNVNAVVVITAEVERYDSYGRPTRGLASGSGFLDHMLTLFAAHGKFDLTVTCKGDNHVDDHHSTEDIGICLGMAFREALGDMKGINRYGDIILPMDEALVMVAVDLSGRSYLGYKLDIPSEKVGTFDTELVEEFRNDLDT